MSESKCKIAIRGDQPTKIQIVVTPLKDVAYSPGLCGNGHPITISNGFEIEISKIENVQQDDPS